jgi:predicted amidophosphoribosyltransferase
MDDERVDLSNQEKFQQSNNIQVKNHQQLVENEIKFAYCTHCGIKNQSGANFCEECGKSLHVTHCPRCGKELISGTDICESCGCYILEHICSFCGNQLGDSDKFCGECGAPVGGLTCPMCKHVSIFDFCQHCNHPLTDRAMQEQKAANADPEYQEIVLLIDELKNYEQEAIEKFGNINISEKPLADNPELIIKQQLKEIQLLYKFYNSLSEIPKPEIRSEKSESVRLFSEKEIAVITEKAKETARDLERKRKELQDKMNKLCNREFPTPQIARNFYSARKPPKTNMVWHCNFADEIHPNPQNCGKPNLGGEWIIEYGEINWIPHDGSS